MEVMNLSYTTLGVSMIIGSLALAIVSLVIRSYFNYRRLQHIEGPWLASVSSLWLFYHTARSRVHLAGQEVLRKYGHFARISTDIILTDDPELFKLMMAPRSSFIRGRWYDGAKFDARADNLLSLRDEATHGRLRSKLMPGYSGKEVPTLEADVDGRVRELVDLIRRDYVEKSQMFDFARLASFYTLDTLTQIGFGKAVGFLKENDDCFDYFKKTIDFFPIIEMSCNFPLVRSILHNPILQRLAGPKPADRVGMGKLIGMAHQAVAEHFQDEKEEKRRDDMIGSFIRHGLTQVECESECILLIIAGSDSTSAALRSTFIHILTSPAAYAKLMIEMEKAIQDKKISSPVIKNNEAQALPYLQACIREGLRMFMPLNGIASKVCTSPDGFTYNGVFIPPNVDIGVAEYTMLRREDIFGPDADTFRPERWLEEESESLDYRRRVQDMTFSTGRTTCLGKQIALMELGKVIFELFRHYEFAVVNPLAEITTWVNGAVLQKNMNIRAWPR